MDQSSISNKILIRESLCGTLLKATYIMDTKPDVLISFSTSVLNLLRYPVEISNATMNNCTRAYLKMIEADVDVASQESTIEIVINTLSVIISLARRFSNDLVDEIRGVLLEISSRRQSITALNEATNIITDSIRFYSSKYRYCDAKTTSFQLPLTGLETYFGSKPTTVSIYKYQDDSLLTDPCSYAVGVSIVQNMNNVRMIGPSVHVVNAIELSPNKAAWDLHKWVGYPNGEWYATYDAILPFANSSGVVFQLISYDELLPLPVSVTKHFSIHKINLQ
jgi:hypothetical protein